MTRNIKEILKNSFYLDKNFVNLIENTIFKENKNLFITYNEAEKCLSFKNDFGFCHNLILLSFFIFLLYFLNKTVCKLNLYLDLYGKENLNILFNQKKHFKANSNNCLKACINFLIKNKPLFTKAEKFNYLFTNALENLHSKNFFLLNKLYFKLFKKLLCTTLNFNDEVFQKADSKFLSNTTYFWWRRTDLIFPKNENDLIFFEKFFKFKQIVALTDDSKIRDFFKIQKYKIDESMQISNNSKGVHQNCVLNSKEHFYNFLPNLINASRSDQIICYPSSVFFVIYALRDKKNTICYSFKTKKFVVFN